MKFLLTLLIFMFFLSFCQLGKAQEVSGLYFSMGGELPAKNLDKNNLISQQYNMSIGYEFPKNCELFLNFSEGILARRDENNGFACNNSGFGIGVNYLHPITSEIKLGLEVLASSQMTDIYEDNNYDHLMYQCGIKGQSKSSLYGVLDVYCILGVRYRSFFDYSAINSLELFYGIGINIDLFEKSK